MVVLQIRLPVITVLVFNGENTEVLLYFVLIISGGIFYRYRTVRETAGKRVKRGSILYDSIFIRCSISKYYNVLYFID